MMAMFYEAKSFNQPLNEWRVDKVSRMSYMFAWARAFNQPLNDWRVDKVTNMSWMFAGASAFNQPLNDWRLRSDLDTDRMFDGASSFDMNRNWGLTNEMLRDWVKRWCDCNRWQMPPISTWNTSKVTDMRWLFKGQTKF